VSNSRTFKSSRLPMQTAFLLLFICVFSGVPQLSYATVPASNAGFVVPVKIETFGKAWDGTLAFGLWQYNTTGSPVWGPIYPPTHSYLVVMTTNGELLDLRETSVDQSYWPVKYIPNDTLMFEGEPYTTTHFWDLKTNQTTNFPNVYGHHDMIYNPFTDTFLTLRSDVENIDGKAALVDQIVELDISGNILWSWDAYLNGHFDLSDACQCNESAVVNGTSVTDLTHANSLQWNLADNIIYFNMRHTDTFCKIDKTTSKMIWCLGKHGNFTLLGSNGQKVSSLWFHSHDLQEVQPDVFSMFDNDYDNTTNATNPCPPTYEATNGHSRILEITVNERNMTAWVSWSWTAPRQDWSPYWGSTDRLPNGDRIGAFGSQSHYLPGSNITSPLPDSTGAVIVEVNQTGGVVRTWTFPYGWGIYRVIELPLEIGSSFATSTSELTQSNQPQSTSAFSTNVIAVAAVVVTVMTATYLIIVRKRKK